MNMSMQSCEHALTFVGTSVDDEHTSSAPPAKKQKTSSQSTGTDHDASNGEVITV